MRVNVATGRLALAYVPLYNASSSSGKSSELSLYNVKRGRGVCETKQKPCDFLELLNSSQVHYCDNITWWTAVAKFVIRETHIFVT